MESHYDKDRASGTQGITESPEKTTPLNIITADNTVTYATGESIKSNAVNHETKKWGEIISFDVIDIPVEVAEKWSADYLKKTYKDGKYFIFGSFDPQERKGKNLINRTDITLDLDGYNSDKTRSLPGFSDMVALLKSKLNGAAFGIYTTFSSTPEKPKYRVIIPLPEPIAPVDYKGIAESTAQIIGADMIDPASFKPAQAMYTPRCFSFNKHYHRSKFIEGVPFNINTLQEQKKQNKIKTKILTITQGGKARPSEKADPRTNRSTSVRVFCTLYDMPAAIDKFLPDVYQREGEKYKYIKSESAAGVKIYDNLFAFSHHSTDPAKLRTLNAFELICWHKFGNPKEKANYKKMEEWVLQRDEIKKAIDDELKKDFKKAHNIDDDDEIGNWFKKLKRNEAGNIKASINNYTLLLENDPKLKGKIRYNVFANEIEVKWKKKKFEPAKNWRAINKNDVDMLDGYLEEKYNISSKRKFDAGFNVLQMKTAYHPVKRFLKSLPAKLPKEPQIPTLFCKLLGAEDNIYTQEVTKKWFVAAVRRIFEPACQWDTVPAFISEMQGTGKSSTLQHLSMGYFTDSPGDFNKEQQVAEQLKNVWIAEIGEMKATRNASAETIKQVISKRFDKCRAAYGKLTDENPRQSVFFATTNDLGYLNDSTGNRRHWPIRVHNKEIKRNSILKEFLDDDEIVKDLWSEAMYYYKTEFKKEYKGKQRYFELSDKADDIAKKEQMKYDKSATDPRLGLVDKWIAEGASWYNEKKMKYEQIPAPSEICVYHIHCECLGEPRAAYDPRKHGRDYVSILKQLGYERTGRKEVDKYGRQYIYTPKNKKK